MKKSAEYLTDLAAQVEAGLITLDEAFDVVAGNEKLTDEQQRMVDQAIADCRNHGASARIAGKSGIRGKDGEEAYAYPHPAGGIAWGFAGGEYGFCIARRVKD